MKTLPKSLHTVTVLVNVARHYQANIGGDDVFAVNQALRILGYTDSPDDYGLANAALKQLARG
jgi:hypothetical protein